MGNLNGQRFGKLLVIGDSVKQGRRKFYPCLCDCGRETLVRDDALTSGGTKSCGCSRSYHQGKTSDNRYERRGRLYHVWYGMKRRCENPKDTSYHRYGGRGITVCEEWSNSYEAFVDWAMESGYDPNSKHKECTLDRIDNNGNYEPSNCRWANMTVQSNNRRSSVLITYQGETLTVAEWAKKVGLNHGALLNRINQGWDIEVALTTPSTKGNRWLKGRFAQ